MMRLLVLDVVPDGVDVRCADGEGPVPLLPSRPLTVFAEPTRGIGLQLLHRLGGGDDRRNTDECMDVISGATDGEGMVVEVLRYACDVGPECWGIGNCEHAIFGGEDEVIENEGIGVRHCAVPLRGTQDNVRTLSRHS